MPEQENFIAYKTWMHRDIPHICCLSQGEETTGPGYCVHGRESQATSLGWSAGHDTCVVPSISRSFVQKIIKGERTDKMMTYPASVGVYNQECGLDMP